MGQRLAKRGAEGAADGGRVVAFNSNKRYIAKPFLTFHPIFGQMTHSVVDVHLYFFLHLVVAVQHLLKPDEHIRTSERVLDFLIRIDYVEQVALRRTGRHGLDTPHAGRHRALADNLEHADFARRLDMGTAAEFHRRPVFDNAHLVAVLFAEQRHRAQGPRLVDGHFPPFFQRFVLTYHAVDAVFHLADFLRRHFLEMREVEAQRDFVDLRAFLFHVRAQHLAQGMVHEVRGRMVTGRLPAKPLFHRQTEQRRRVGRQAVGPMDDELVFLARVAHFDAFGLGAVGRQGRDIAPVAGLTAGLGVKRRLLEHKLILFLAFLVDAPVTQQPAFHHQIVVADKTALAARMHIDPIVGRYLGRVARTVFLPLQAFFKFGQVYGHALFFENQLGEVNRKAVGIVKRKRVFAADFLLPLRPCLFRDLVQQLDAGFQRFEESVFLFLHHAFDERLLAAQFGEGRAHLVAEHLYELMDKRLFEREEGIIYEITT